MFIVLNEDAATGMAVEIFTEVPVDSEIKDGFIKMIPKQTSPPGLKHTSECGVGARPDVLV